MTTARERLSEIIGAVEKHEMEIADLKRTIGSINSMISAQFKLAKSEGFDVATIKAIIAERKIPVEERLEREALKQIYRRTLGMFDDTPLGNAALKRFEDQRRQQGKPEADAPDFAEVGENPSVTPPIWSNDDEEMAEQRGRDDARADKPVTANPYPPRDPRRQAWDVGWCAEQGGDGMDIPPALRPKKADEEKPADDKKPDGEGNGEGDDEEAGDDEKAGDDEEA